MARSPAPYLQRRNGVYHFRIRVPSCLQCRMQRGDLRWTLNTYSLRIAAPLALEIATGIKRVFQLAEQHSLSADEIIAMARVCFERLAVEVDNADPISFAAADSETSFQALTAEERIAELEALLGTDAEDPQAVKLASEFVKERNWALTNLDQASRARIQNGIIRALIEQQRLLRFRLTEPLMPYAPADPLFANAKYRKSAGSEGPDNASGKPCATGPSLDDAVTAYLKFGASHWTPKTVKDWRAKIERFVELVGPSRPITEITADDLRYFRDRLCELHKNHHNMPGSSWMEKLTPNEQHRITPKTAANILDATKRFFRWAHEQEGYLNANPAAHVKLKVPQSGSAKLKRRPFNSAELETLFSSPLFIGYRSKLRKHEPGSTKRRDAYFWLPILGLATGARLGELVQLHIDDIKEIEGIQSILITDANTGPANSDYAKHLKSSAATREIPLHPQIIELGFLEFVEERRSKAKHKRLFHEIKLGTDGQASTAFSKWFNRYLDRIGLDAPGLVFHSFRHLAQDTFRNAQIPKYVIDRIISHAGNDVSDSYGAGVSIKVRRDAVVQAGGNCIDDVPATRKHGLCRRPAKPQPSLRP